MLFRLFYGDENNIAITSNSDHRSFVNGVGGRYGTWGEYADSWVYAHEAGHLMGLPDDYHDVTNPDGTISSLYNPVHKGHMMGDYGGTVNQHEVDSLLNNVECPCDEK